MTPSVTKPLMRGWFHVGMVPLAMIGGLILLVLTPTVQGRVGSAVWLTAALILFGISGLYHRGNWPPKVEFWLRRTDHANIFLFIAGCYTPLALLLLPSDQATLLLGLIWTVAALGVAREMLWHSAPRWLDVVLYIAMGWLSIAWMGSFYATGGVAVVALMAAGGLAYTLGAIVYALKWPNPSPKYFGYYEIFHAGTVIGASCHYAAILVAAIGLR